jgi:hypothetical protein
MNKLKLRHAALIVLGFLTVGYFFGQILPIDFLRPTILIKELTIYDLYTCIISVVGTIVTFLAVIVALFKEDIRKIWDKAELIVCFRDENELHEILDNETSSPNYRAKKYETVLLVKNKGSLAAKSCEIYLESLQFKSQTYPSLQDIALTGQPLNWHNNSNTSILIPATGKATVPIIEIISPESQSVPTEQTANSVTIPKIKIGDTDSPEAYSNGTWIAKFIIYSENARPIELIFSITWNNKWEHRLSEMRKYVKIQINRNN